MSSLSHDTELKGSVSVDNLDGPTSDRGIVEHAFNRRTGCGILKSPVGKRNGPESVREAFRPGSPTGTLGK